MKTNKPYLILVLTMVGLFLPNTEIFPQQAADQLYEKALYLEEAKGEMQQAIDLYQEIIKQYPGNRQVIAKALLHTGFCYEKLGLKEAKQVYRLVINDYSENKDEVSLARVRLAILERALTDLSRKLTFRKINIACNPQNGVLSPDGNKLAFILDSAVWIIPLHGKINADIAGEPVRLARIPNVWDYESLMAWSADGKWIAVNGQANGKDAAYVIPVAGGEPRVVSIPDRGDHNWSNRLSLSPDGQMLAFSAVRLNTRVESPDVINRFIYTIPVAGGEPKQVSSAWANLPSFSSDGKFISYVGYTERDDWQENTERLRYNGDLWVVSSAGGTPLRLAHVDGRLRGPVWSPDGKYIAAHYVPGLTSDSREIWVYPLSPDASRVEEPEKIALPRSSWNVLAGWAPNNELGVFIQSEEHAAIYTVEASGGMAVQITPEIMFPYYPGWSPDGEHIYFRSFDKKMQSLIGCVPATGGDPVEVPVQLDQRLMSRVPGGGHKVSPNGKRIVVSVMQQPYELKKGVDIWTIPVEGGLPTRLTNDKSFEGYPCWSPDGRSIAFTDWQEKSKDEGFNVINVIPSEGGEIRQISSETDSVADGAIAYSPDGKRIAFFSGGAIKTISVKGGQAEVLISNIMYDSDSELAYSPDGSKIAHNAEGKIWITLLDGGKPQELRTGLPKESRHGGFSWSPDGEKIAFSSNIGGEAEFWMISNFLTPDKK